jgi:hypothetical protein
MHSSEEGVGTLRVGERSSSKTPRGAVEAIKDMLLFDWQLLDSKVTAVEERKSDVERFDRLLCLAESVRFNGAVILAFEEGYLRTITAADNTAFEPRR